MIRDYRALFLEFFKAKGHAIIPSASLIPENDATVLFITAGMQPLAPYLLGEEHPAGKRLANSQKCVRTSDIDEVGDNRHLTFFEMLGNWSLGDYFKNESIAWSWEFLTEPEWLGIDPSKIFVTVFAGNSEAPRDKESIVLWSKIFHGARIDPKVDLTLVNGGRIFSYPAIGYLNFPENKNWWQPGPTGPQGPDTEIFFDTGITHDPKFGLECHPNCDCGRFIEIWNNVFMQYHRVTADAPLTELKNKNVDTGMGLERVTALLENKPTPFETTMFRPIISQIEEITGRLYTDTAEVTRAMRIIADHLRAATFIIGDQNGVGPANVDQGYVVRRLLRRAIRYGYGLGVRELFLARIAKQIISQYGGVYNELETNRDRIISAVQHEEEKFNKTLARGVSIIEVLRREISELGNALDHLAGGAKDDTAARAVLMRAVASGWCGSAEILKNILLETDSWVLTSLISRFRDVFMVRGDYLFTLYASDGLPLELVKEFLLFNENNEPVRFLMPVRFDEAGYINAFAAHQMISRAGAAQKFAGGMADNSFISTRLHTATHLLHQALRNVLGASVFQKGSNITPERLRFDFSHDSKITSEQLKRVHDMVNEQIKRDLVVHCDIVTVAEAKKLDAIGLFEEKYASVGEKIKMYTIGEKPNVFSREICGGPHVEHTAEIGRFKIQKEESVSSGVRRIRAVVE